jgi:hypothetical protein
VESYGIARQTMIEHRIRIDDFESRLVYQPLDPKEVTFTIL